MWTFVEAFEGDVTVSLFATYHAAMRHIEATNYAEEPGFEAEFKTDGGGAAKMEFSGDDFIELKFVEVQL